MGRADHEFVTHCLELLAGLGPARSRRMFGGHGLYVDDVFIALVAEDVLYLKADEQTQPVFQGAGCQAFEYSTRDGRRTVMSYWTAPQEAMESPALMLPWARLAMASALRAAASKRPAAARSTAARPRKPAPATPSAKPGVAGHRPRRKAGT